jgi:hypothetical protein
MNYESSHWFGRRIAASQKGNRKENMEDIEKLKEDVRKLSALATSAKKELHDLSEELPLGWERIMEIAEKTRSAYAALTGARAKLQKASSA